MAGNIGYLSAPDILIELFSTLKGLTYPVSADQDNHTPDVWFMGETGEVGAGVIGENTLEQIELVGAVANGTIEWQNTGRIKAESFSIEIVVRTAVPGKTGPEALVRANALAEVVQAGLRDDTTGQPIGLTDTRVIRNYRVEGFEINPFATADEGWGMEITLSLQVNTRH